MSMARSCAGNAAGLWLAVLCPAAAMAGDACTAESGPIISLIATARDLGTRDGRAFRLAGVQPGASFPAEGDFTLIILDDRPDRWGRMPVIAIPQGGSYKDSLNLAAIREGLSLAMIADLPPACVPEALAAEADARKAMRGIWRKAPPLVRSSDLAALRAREGQFTLVQGRVLSVREGRRRAFLNFGSFGSERFSVIIALSHRPAFDAAGLDLAALKGQDIEVRGLIVPGPSMELTAPAALVKLRRP